MTDHYTAEDKKANRDLVCAHLGIEPRTYFIEVFASSEIGSSESSRKCIDIFYDYTEKMGTFPPIDIFEEGYYIISQLVRGLIDENDVFVDDAEKIAADAELNNAMIELLSDDIFDYWEGVEKWIADNLPDDTYNMHFRDNLSESISFSNPDSQILWRIWSHNR